MHRVGRRIACAALCFQSVAAWRWAAPIRAEPSLKQQLSSLFASAVLCASLTLTTPLTPANAAYLDTDLKEANARLQSSAIKGANAFSTLIKAQSPEALSSITSAVVDIGLGVDQGELTKLIDLSLDAVDTVDLKAFGKEWKDAVSALSPDACDAFLPLPTAALDRIASADGVAGADAARRSRVVEQLLPAWKSLPKRDGAVCLPPASTLEKIAIAQTDAAATADLDKVIAAREQAARTVKSVPKSKAFRLFGEYNQQQLAALGRVPLIERDRVKKSGQELAAANAYAEEIRLQRAKGPPKCFTVGCQVNFENDIWRYNSKDDYTGEGLEKTYSILKPKGYTFEGK